MLRGVAGEPLGAPPLAKPLPDSHAAYDGGGELLAWVPCTAKARLILHLAQNHPGLPYTVKWAHSSTLPQKKRV